MKKLTLTYVDPKSLVPNKWNPNEVDPINQKKLMRSIQTEGFVNPVKVRELDDGSLEIIGGEHRTRAAIEMGMSLVPIVNLGKIDDGKAKRVLMLDNQRYGEDDMERLAELLSSDDIGSAEHLLSIMPIDEAELASFFSHANIEDVDLDDMDLNEDDHIEFAQSSASKVDTQILRFKVSIEAAEKITRALTQIKHDQGFGDADRLTNDGLALVQIFQEWLRG